MLLFHYFNKDGRKYCHVLSSENDLNEIIDFCRKNKIKLSWIQLKKYFHLDLWGGFLHYCGTACNKSQLRDLIAKRKKRAVKYGSSNH